MRLYIALAVAVVVVAGCGGGNDDGSSAAEPSTEAETSTAAEEGPSEDCELAVLTWKRAANDAVGDAIFEVPFDEPEARDRPTDEIEVYCSQEVSAKVAEANYELALLNAGLTVCQNVPENCDADKNEGIREKVQVLVAEVDGLIA